MSAVRLDSISLSPAPIRLLLSGVDILDGAPVLDIKPYVPYADCLPEARGGFASERPPESISVAFSKAAETALSGLSSEIPKLRDLIVQMIRIDPRPAYYGSGSRKDGFGTRIHHLEVKWTCREGDALVTSVEPS
jgi:hypothetical protein